MNALQIDLHLAALLRKDALAGQVIGDVLHVDVEQLAPRGQIELAWPGSKLLDEPSAR